MAKGSLPGGESLKDKNMGYIVLAGAVFLALAFMINTGASQTDDMAPDDRSTDIVNDIEPYNGSIGPGSALYGLKIAFEKFDEAFTFNSSRKIQKQIEHARLRLAEVKAGLNRNDIEEVNRAIERYREKIEEINESVSGFTGNASQLVVEQRRIIRHQLVLRQLLESHPDSPGLERAFNNSQRLEERFELKTRVKFEREIEDRQRIRIREIEIEKREIKTEIRGNAAEVKIRVKFLSDSTDRETITRQVLDRIKLAKDDINNLIEIETEAGATPTATATVTGTAAATPAVTGTPEAAEDRLKIEVEAGRGVSEVEAELQFSLNTIDRDEIVEGIFQKVSALTIDDINRLEIEIRERREDRREDRQEDRREDRRGTEAGDDRGGGSSRGGGDD